MNLVRAFAAVIGEAIMSEHNEQTRRRFLAAGAAAAGGFAAGPEFSFAQQLPPTPECRDGDAPTIRQTEGPFFTPRSPQRSDLRESGLKGRTLELTGLVLTRTCRPVAGALVDLWHADADGNYDNRGYRLRGHQFTDGQGRYTFRTIVPASYPGRTRHYHVKVQAPRQPELTTQLYFPDDPLNRRDGFFRQELLMRVADAGGHSAARFDFVLDLR
jgi:protocatechuate 3,4-dioxygenase beta subunit